MYAVGYSAGANLLIKYAGEDHCFLKGIVSIGNPWCYDKSIKNL